MNPEVIIFYLFSFLTLGGAVYILVTRNVLYAAFGLLVVFLGVAALYVLARADFLAIAQVMIYVGGILVLVMFAIMLSKRITGDEVKTGKKSIVFQGLFAAIAVFSMLQILFSLVDFNSMSWIQKSTDSGAVIQDTVIRKTGIHLMTGYLLPFELAAVILLVALLGAAYLASHLVKKKGSQS